MDTQNWKQFAVENKQCFARLVKTATQATRQGPSREISFWDVFLPTPHGVVSCPTIEAARTLAARYGCSILI